MTVAPPEAPPVVDAPPDASPFDGYADAWDKSGGKFIFDALGYVPEVVTEGVIEELTGQLALWNEAIDVTGVLLAAGDNIFGMAVGWFEDVVADAIHAAALIAGVATTDDVSRLWSACNYSIKSVFGAVSTLRHYVNHLGASLLQKINGVERELYDQASYLAGAAQAGDRFILGIVGDLESRVAGEISDVTNIIETTVVNVVNELPTLQLPDIQGMIDSALQPITDRLDALEPLLTLAPLIALVPTLTALPGVVADNAARADECCAANSGRLNNDEDLLNRLRPLLDLLGLLGLTIGAHELLAAIQGFISDDAPGIEHQLADWLDT